MSDFMICFNIIGLIVAIAGLGILIYRSDSEPFNSSAFLPPRPRSGLGAGIGPWPPNPPPVKQSNYSGYKIILNRGKGKDRILKFLSDEELGYIITGDDKLDEIMNYHLSNGRDIFKCQQDLIDASYESLARI